MEPLVRLRLHGSQLTDAETRKLMTKILRKYGNEKFLSLLFNHYLTKYQQSGEHDHELLDINGLISTILNARKGAENESREEKQERAPIVVNSMPSALIGECASYLQAKDYVNFAHCDRKMYIACYSPSRLVEIDCAGHNCQCNLNQFPSLKSLKINAKKFNKYMRAHPNHTQFHRLQCLDVSNYKGKQADIGTFLKHKCFDFENITILTCSEFGPGIQFGGFANDVHFDFDVFIGFLSHFPNVTNLTLEDLVLSGFNDQNEKISKLFPKLTVLSGCGCLLSRKLLNLRSEQLISICCDSRKFPKITCPLLEELYLVRPLKNDEQFKNVLPNINKLQRISIRYDPDFDDQFKKLIRRLFVSRHLEYVSLRSGSIETVRKVMALAESAAFTTKRLSKKSLVFDIGNLFLASNSDQQQFVNLDLPRLVNALDASKIQNFMIKMEIFLNGEDDGMVDYIRNMDKNWKDSHLFNSEKLGFDEYRIVISNKDCTINGYSPGWMFWANKTN